MTTAAQIDIQFEWKVAGVLTDVTSAKLSDATGSFGVKRVDTGEVIVADGTDMAKIATGTYRYSFTPVQRGLTYFYYIEIVAGGVTRRIASVKYDPYPSALEISDFLATVQKSFLNEGLVADDLVDPLTSTLQHMTDEGILFVDVATGTLTASQQYEKAPNEYMGMSALNLFDMSGNQKPPLTPIKGGFRAYQEAVGDSAGGTGLPEWWTYNYGNFYLYKVPDAAYPYTLFYYRGHPSYDGTIYYPLRFKSVISLGIKFYYAMQIANDEYVKLWQPLFFTRLASVKKSIVYEPSIVEV